jgi:putative hydrolase of the HAD superfamily
MNSALITTLFVDIGNVILTNGWDREMRKRAAHGFGLDYSELDERHHLLFDIYEVGKLSLEDYLDRVVFHKKRSFSVEDFKAFMFGQSQMLPEMFDLIRRTKAVNGLKVVAVSNEGRELTQYRIEKFKLKSIIDFFISSCFVHFRKPDPDIFFLAMECAQARPEEIAYIDDRGLFVEAAGRLGIHGIHHTDCETTRAALEALGLSPCRGVAEHAGEECSTPLN